jgi:legumain
MGTCLGDQFSIAWMEDTESNELSAETLSHQFETLKSRTTKSPVQKFGEKDIMADFVGEYLGTFADPETKQNKTAGEKADVEMS